MGIHRTRRASGSEYSAKRSRYCDERLCHSCVYRIARKIAANAAILKRLAEIDKALLEHDTALRDIYQKLLPLLAPPPEPPRRQIGFSAAS